MSDEGPWDPKGPFGPRAGAYGFAQWRSALRSPDRRTRRAAWVMAIGCAVAVILIIVIALALGER